MSREHELLTGLKRDTQLTFDGSGNLKLQKANQVEPCNTSSEIQVKYALTRRALAFEQANLVKFSLMEAWSEKMMQCRLEEPQQWICPNHHETVGTGGPETFCSFG